MTKVQKEAQAKATALGEQYGKAARKTIVKAQALGGDAVTNMKAFMSAFLAHAVPLSQSIIPNSAKPTKSKKVTK